jgi:hypothetical protein
LLPSVLPKTIRADRGRRVLNAGRLLTWMAGPEKDLC